MFSSLKMGVGPPRKPPRQHHHGEFADAFESVGQQADHVDQRKEHHAQMRQIRAGVTAEAGLNPFRAGHHIGTPQPLAHEHHQENLVESRPKPRQPEAFQAINEQNINQPHCAADIEHARSIGNAQHVPGQRFAAQEIGIHVLGAAPRNPKADHNYRGEIADDDGDINCVEFHGGTGWQTVARAACRQSAVQQRRIQ